MIDAIKSMVGSFGVGRSVGGVRQFKSAERIAFYVDMAAFTKEGIPPYRAITDMLAIAQKRKRPIAHSYKVILKRLKEGASLSASLKGLVPPIQQVMILAGDQSGKLDETLAGLGEMLERVETIKSTMKMALFKNGVMMVALFSVMYFVIQTVAPAAVDLLSPEIQSKMMFAPYYFAAGNFILNNVLFIIAAFAVYITWVMMALPKWVGQWRAKFDQNHLPFSLYRLYNSSFFLAAMAAMMQSGMPMRDAIMNFESQSSGWLRFHYRKMHRFLKQGKTEVDALDTGFFPEDVADRLKVYAQLPSVTQIMVKLSDYSLKYFEKRVMFTTGLIQTSLMIVTAIFILSTIFAMGETSFTISDTAGQMQQ